MGLVRRAHRPPLPGPHAVARPPPVLGNGGLQIRPAGLPAIGNFFAQVKGAEYRDGLLKHIKDWGGGSPLFVAGAVNAWSWTPSDVAELDDELLGDSFEIVRGDVFFDALNRAGSREG
ncbi:hypothetical protein ACWFR5_47480 [Streptomyces sp. NPDC055092]